MMTCNDDYACAKSVEFAMDSIWFEALVAAAKKRKVSRKASCHVVPLLKEWMEVPDSNVVCWKCFGMLGMKLIITSSCWDIDYRSLAKWLLSGSAPGNSPLQST